MGFKRFRKTNRFIWQMFSTKPPRVAYVAGWNGHQNLGDEAIYAALQQLFCPAGFVDYPKGLESKLSLKVLSRIELALLAGGTLIGGKTSTVAKVKQCFKRCPHSIVFGTGVNHPSFWAERFGLSNWQHCQRQWKEVLRKCQYVGVRGPMSAELLADLGLSNVEIIGDPVLIFAKKNVPSEGSWESNTIGLNICQTKGYMWGDENYICEQYIKLARTARKAGWKIMWFVLWPKDLDLTKKIAAASKTTDRIYRIYQDYNIYLDLVKSVSVFVGMRLHSVALATCAYVPSIMLEYRPKCRDYMRAIGQNEVTIRTDSVKAEYMWEIIQTLGLQRQKISESLFQAIKTVRERQLLQSTKLKNIYGLGM